MPLPRRCLKCNRRFKPSTRSNKVCPICNARSMHRPKVNKEIYKSEIFVKPEGVKSEEIKGLWTYEYTCLNCKQRFGSDYNSPKQNKWCPKCNRKLNGMSRRIR